jgi:DNA-binding transcriptional MerR regulator
VNQVPDSGLSAGEAARRIGVAVTTLRTWDRRYGLGPSHRDPGRHRRYTRQDLARLELMRRLTVDGVAPAEAARVVSDSGAAHWFAADAPGLRPPPRPDSGTARGLRRAALALDPAGVERLLGLALAQGVEPAWTSAIAPALRQLGRQHAAAGRYIAAEHLLSGAVSAALGRVPRPATRPRILLACAPAELHTLPLEALAAALTERGTATRLLGARVPAGALREAIARTGPGAVVLWAHAPGTADSGQLAAALTAHPRPPLIAACGPGWPPRALAPGTRTFGGLGEAVAALASVP